MTALLDRAIARTRTNMITAGFVEPRIAVAALNPHAGDGGNFGSEEIEVIGPAVEAVLASRGVALDHATVTNGGATSYLWKRIHASVLGVPLRTIRDHPGASLGAAFAGGMGVGAYAAWDEPLALVVEGDVVDPDPAWVGRYDEAYGLWRELGDVTAGTMRALARG